MERFTRVRSIASNKYVSDIDTHTQAALAEIDSVMWCSRFCHGRAQPPPSLAFAVLWQKISWLVSDHGHPAPYWCELVTGLGISSPVAEATLGCLDFTFVLEARSEAAGR